MVAGLVIGLGIFSWNSSGLLGNQLPMPLGVGAAVVLSGSMEPTLKTNDLVVVTQRDDYNVGDIVVYETDNSLVIHRIVGIDGEYITAQGDANNVPDDPVMISQVKGAMLFRLPFVGNIFKFIKSIPGTVMIVAIALYLLYRSRLKEQEADQKELLEIANEIRELRRKKELAESKAAAKSSVTSSVKNESSKADETEESDVESEAVDDEPEPVDDPADDQIDAPDSSVSIEIQTVPEEIADDLKAMNDIIAFKNAVESHESDSEMVEEILSFNSEHSVHSDDSNSSADKSK